jgi:hypothetical protein
MGGPPSIPVWPAHLYFPRHANPRICALGVHARYSEGVRAGLVALLTIAYLLTVDLAAGAEAIPNRHQMEALYVIDHHGRNPRGEADLRLYSAPFQRIVTRCSKLNVDLLTNMAIWLADKASVMGGRRVSSLMMLQSIARRITWEKGRQPCSGIYDQAEGHLEAGDP